MAVGGILAALMDRLTKHATDTPEMVAVFVEVDAFGKFMACAKAVVAVGPARYCLPHHVIQHV